MVRINRVYTGTGDDKMSSFVDGSRHRKSHLRFSAVGTCDELNSIVASSEENALTCRSCGWRHQFINLRIQKLPRQHWTGFRMNCSISEPELACDPSKLPEYMELISNQQCDLLMDEMDAGLFNLNP